MKTIQRGIYHHFKDKNKLYEVLGVAMHSETEESLVLYRWLYGDYKMMVRPLEMFLEEVDKPEYKYKGPRFVLVQGME